MPRIVEEILLSLNLKARFIPELKHWVFSRPRIKDRDNPKIDRSLIQRESLTAPPQELVFNKAAPQNSEAKLTQLKNRFLS